MRTSRQSYCTKIGESDTQLFATSFESRLTTSDASDHERVSILQPPTTKTSVFGDMRISVSFTLMLLNSVSVTDSRVVDHRRGLSRWIQLDDDELLFSVYYCSHSNIVDIWSRVLVIMTKTRVESMVERSALITSVPR